MSYKIRTQTKRTLSETLEPAYLSERILDWFEEYKKLIIWIGIISFFTSLALLGWVYVENKDSKTAQLMEYEASLTLLDAQLYSEDPDAQKEALQAAISQFQEIIQKFPRTNSASIARYKIGNSYSAIGEYKNAIESYEAFMKKDGSGNGIAPLVAQRMGYAYLKLGKTEESEKYFKMVTPKSKAYNRDVSLLELAQITERKGEKEEALSKYQEIIDQFSSSPIASEARGKIKALGRDAQKESKTTGGSSQDDSSLELSPPKE